MLLHWSIFICLICIVSCTLSPDDTKEKKKSKYLSGPVDTSVEDRNLVKAAISVKEILQNHAAYHRRTDLATFEGPILGYVTPWNNHGYDVAKTFGKFSLISPVWLQLKPTADGYEVTGTHDVDAGWIRDVRKAGKLQNVKVVPRLLFEGFTGRDAMLLFQSDDRRRRLANTVLTAVQDLNLDGVVVEVWSQFGGQQRQNLAALVRQLAATLRHRRLTVGLVIPPAVYQGGRPGFFSGHDFDALKDDIDFVSLMTYDYSSPQRPGPNSPLDWVKECVEALSSSAEDRRKILLGLNFYGNDYTTQGGGPIIGRQFIDLLSEARKVKINWDDSSREHLIQFKTSSGQHAVFFPSLKSIQERVALAEQLGTGLSIWELGQGLQYFYDLL